MLPYSGNFYFYVLAFALVPAIVLGLCGKRIKYYGVFICFPMLVFIFLENKLQILCLVLFFFSEWLLIKLYFRFKDKVTSKKCFWVFVVLSLVPLFVSKVIGLTPVKLSLGFLGISYLTFKTVQMLLEAHDGLIKSIKFLDYSYFVLFFPTISSGPIDRSRRFLKDADKTLTRSEYISCLSEGIWKIALGAGYKFIIAYFISSFWMDAKLPNFILNKLSYMYAYSFYMFFDFAGYSLIAIGVSYILGIRTPDNFNKPFLSLDIKEFWTRWHMSLSFWFRDYLYTRFVMASLKKSVFKSKYTASYIGYFITMGTMGFWHGFTPYYILYGLYHGLLIVLTDLFQRKSGFYAKHKKTRAYKLASWFVTFNLICFGFLLFSGNLLK